MLVGFDAEEKGDHCRITVYKLATQKLSGSPFSDEFIDKARGFVDVALVKGNCVSKKTDQGREQSVLVRDMQGFLKFSGDSDWPILDKYAAGVHIGWDRKMSRAPALYERKKHWALGKEKPSTEHDMTWQDNYESMLSRPDVWEEKPNELGYFAKGYKAGRMREVELRVAREKWPGRIAVGALGLAPGDRIAHDGTFGAMVNHRIKVRDQGRSPLIRDLRAAQRAGYHEAGESALRFDLVLDNGKTHRTVQVHGKDQAIQACVNPSRVVDEEGDEVIQINTVGTFGINSAAYFWGRLISMADRASHYALGPDVVRMLWTFIFADDWRLSGRGKWFAFQILIVILVLGVFGYPIKWGKLRGGLESDYVGYWLDWKAFCVGISEKRSVWLINWSLEVHTAGVVEMEEFGAVLGRWSFVAQILEADRPFLGPMFAWAAAAPRQRVLVIPPMVAMAAAWLKKALQRRRSVDSRELRSAEGVIFKTEACAERTTGSLGIGGWRCADDTLPKDALWFSLTLTKGHLPWAFSKEEDPKRVIAALELLGSVVAVK